MKVAIITAYWKNTVGRVTTYLINLSEELQNKGDEVRANFGKVMIRKISR